MEEMQDGPQQHVDAHNNLDGKSKIKMCVSPNSPTISSEDQDMANATTEILPPQQTMGGGGFTLGSSSAASAKTASSSISKADKHRQGMMSLKKVDKLSELKERCFNRLSRERQ